MKNNFSRSNVNEQMLNISMPDMSAFPMSHNVTLTPRMGEILPFNVEPLLPRSVISGVNKPTLQLEKILTPSIGRVRMDTHNFVVLQNRINRDWKFYIEGKSGYEQKPAFYPFKLMCDIFCYLCLDKSCNYDTKITESKFETAPWDGAHFSNVFLPQLNSTFTDLSYQSTIQGLLSSALHKYDFLIKSDNHFMGYNKDFFLQEYSRLYNYYSSISSLDIKKELPNFADVILQVLKPFFGEGSLFDMLGYPIFDQYSQLYETIKAVFTPDSNYPYAVDDNHYYSSIAAKLSANNTKWSQLFTLAGVVLQSVHFFNDTLKDESPLRAYYAVWFDYFRNFHIEKREDILDPDTFGYSSIIATAISNIEYVAQPETARANYFNELVSLIIPRKRNFARDYITTIQVDDIYRYVYTPWTLTSGTTVNSTVNPSDDDNADMFYQGIQSILLGDTNRFFPTGLIGESVDSFSVLQADLQTMRRSKMLERVLAREYYYPDTYAGRMQAHYGIKPGDIDAMNSVYLSGSEQFISGNQEIANVGTDFTPQGTRTMVAGVSSTDPFNYAATDHAIFISTISLVPMVSYNSTNAHLDELTLQSLPLPQFASDTRCLILAKDLLRGFEAQGAYLGYVPRYYAYRLHADETHGKYLTDYRAYNFMRDWWNMTAKTYAWNQSGQGVLERNDLSLNPYFLRVNVPLDAFLGLQPWDSIAFGNIEIDCQVTHPLPAAIEFI